MAYSQNDPAWKNDFLGNTHESGDTVGNYGCYLTAISNACTWAGRDLNPGEMNGLCRDNGWFTQDLINRDDVPALVCGNLEFAGRTNWSGATDMSFFDDASDPNVAYIIMIDASPAAGLQTHFVMVWKTYGNGDLQIDDSWDGKRKKLSAYGTPSKIIYSAIKYIKKTPPQEAPSEPTPPPTPTPDPVPPTPDPTPAPAPEPTPDPVPSPTSQPDPLPTSQPTPSPTPPTPSPQTTSLFDTIKGWLANIIKFLEGFKRG